MKNREAYQQFVKTIVEEESSKHLWKFMKSKKCDSIRIAPLVDQSETVTESEDKADLLNKQFCSMFTTDNKSILGSSPTKYPVP